MLFFNSPPKEFLEDPGVQLMLAFGQGQENAFDQIVDKYYKSIHSFISRFILDEDMAEDLTQEVFIKLHGLKKSYQPKAKLTTLLYQIARNTSLNYLRANKKMVHITDENEAVIEKMFPQQPFNSLEEEEKSQIIQKVLNTLPENQRTAVILARFNGLSYEEIAQTMQISSKAVKSLLNRAKEKLALQLKKFF